jgi:hypothetical protein
MPARRLGTGKVGVSRSFLAGEARNEPADAYLPVCDDAFPKERADGRQYSPNSNAVSIMVR